MKSTLYASLVLAHLAFSSLYAAHTPLHDTAAEGNIEQFFQVYGINHNYVHEQDEDGNTPLHIAALNQHNELLQACVEKDIWVLSINNNRMSVATCTFFATFAKNMLLANRELATGLLSGMILTWQLTIREPKNTFDVAALDKVYAFHAKVMAKMSQESLDNASTHPLFIFNQTVDEVRNFIEIEERYKADRWRTYVRDTVVVGTVVVGVGAIAYICYTFAQALGSAAGTVSR